MTEIIEVKYPAGLVDWAGDRKGGVRKPFYEGSGRPCADVIETSLLRRLREWTASLSMSRPDVPRSLILVGGPGNGKTESVEQAVSAFDSAFECDGALVRAFAGAFKEGVSARKVIVPTGVYGSRSGIGEVVVLQDASMTDPQFPGKGAAELFLMDLDEIAEATGDRVYLVCANRGILDDALFSDGLQRSDKARNLLDAIVGAIEQTPEASCCWPLAGFPLVAAWPMDVESLFHGSIQVSPAAQILDRLLNKEKWHNYGECPAGDHCPFCSSRAYLEKPADRESLLKILHWSELAVGRRWSFRDLFSLFAYLFAGNAAKEEQAQDPCKWADHLWKVAEGHDSEAASRRFGAPFRLATALYQHALFPFWPRPNARKLRSDIKEVGLLEDEGMMGLFYFLTVQRGRFHPETLEAQLAALGKELDPALADPADTIQLSTRTLSLGQDIDAPFGQSVKVGLEACRRLLDPLEVRVLQRLSKTDQRLASPEIRTLHPATTLRLQAVVREFACRFVRRSLGVRYGVVRNRQTLADYAKVGERDPALVRKAIKEIAALLHEGNRFKVSLNTTFGEPASTQGRSVMLYADKQTINTAPDAPGERPASSLRFLKIGSNGKTHLIPLTYELFLASRELEQGMLASSLPGTVLALLDASRAKLAGSLVRSGEDGNSDIEIRLGNLNMSLRHDLGKFFVEREATK